MGPPMASWGDVIAWCQVCELDLFVWERETLVRLAYLRAAVQGEKISEQMKNKKS